jgi:hypothetical protein
VSKRALVSSLVALVLITAGCSSSKGSGGPTGSAPPTIVPSSQTGHGKPVNLRALLLRHITAFKQEPDAANNKDTGLTEAIKDDGRKAKPAGRNLHRARFVMTYQRVWTGFGGTTIRVILQQYRAPGGPPSYLPRAAAALKAKFRTTTPVTVPGIPVAVGFTHKTKKQQSTVIFAPVGLVLMQVRITGRVALGQEQRAITVATRQYKRL